MLATTFFMAFFTAAVLPAVNSAHDAARATAMKNKGRGIWISVVSANTEREILDMAPLWPGDLARDGKKFENAEEYFCYLMSDGEDTKVIARDPSNRVVPDLKPEMLVGPGMTAAVPGGPLRPENNAWHVVNIDDESWGETPFLVTRNIKASAISYSTEAELENLDAAPVPVPLDKNIQPFKNTLGVWVTKGGAMHDARQRYLIRARLVFVRQPADQPDLTVLPAQGGFQ